MSMSIAKPFVLELSVCLRDLFFFLMQQGMELCHLFKKCSQYQFFTLPLLVFKGCSLNIANVVCSSHVIPMATNIKNNQKNIPIQNLQINKKISYGFITSMSKVNYP